MKVLASFNKNNTSNTYYFTPHYEVLENGGGLREIHDRKSEFPNSGTFFMPQSSDEVDIYAGRLLRISVDTSYTSPTYKFEFPYSCAYISYPNDIDHFSATEMIEIFEIERTIDQIIDSDDLRIITLPAKPLNNRIMLKLGNYLYGCFEYTVVMNSQTGYQTLTGSQVHIKISAAQNSDIQNSILKYRYEDLAIHIYHAKLPQTYSENRIFIYNQEILNRIKPIETLDFIDNNSLLNFFKKLIVNRENIAMTNDQLRTIKEVISDLQEVPFRDSRIRRLSNFIDLSGNLMDYRNSVLDEYFYLPKSAQFKEEYLNQHPDKLNEIVESMNSYNEIKSNLEKEKSQILAEVKVVQEELAKAKMESQGYALEALKVKQYELDKLNLQILESTDKLDQLMKKLNIYEEYDRIQNKISALKRESEHLEYNKGQLEKFKESLGRDIDGITRDIREKIVSLAGSKMDADIIDFMFRTIQDQRTVVPVKNVQIVHPEEIETELPIEELIRIFMDNMNNKAKRRITYNEAINLMVSITQNFITVLAGLPGVGKTTLCTIIAKTLGLYGKRFIKIPVERGWTSRKDLIGYYNPISKTIEKTNIDFYDCLVSVDSEQKQGRGNIPYLVLLDEANLSPIEHYWANFMTLCDSHTDDPIVIGEDCRFYLSDGFRMVATINYDHTTETLSHRFLDRAWVILIEAPDSHDMLEYAYTEEDVDNSSKIIDFHLLKKYFMPNKEDVLQPQVSNVMNEIINLFRLCQPVSARSIKAVLNYCVVAQRLMDLSKENLVPLDFAVSQKILPLINGNGDVYLDMMDKLINICKQNSLFRCTSTLEAIKENGIQQYGYFNFFNR